MAAAHADQDLADRYRFYLGLCNAGDFDRFDQVVADELVVNGTPTTRAGYAEQIATLRAAFPDYRWDLRQLVVDGPLLAARLVAAGTHTGAEWLGLPANGTPVIVDEQALYTWSAGRIAEVWSVSDRLETLGQLRAGADARHA